MAVNIQQIKELRERTSAGMGDCKKALVEAEGDMDKAVEVILKKGQAKSAKRAGKVAAEGVVVAEVFGNTAAVIEVNIETDFSARNDKFLALVGRVTEAVKANTDDAAELGKLVHEGKTLVEHASELTAVIGEKITLRRYATMSVPDGKEGLCHSYVHMGGKIGVAVCIEADNAAAAGHEATKTFADETAMQIAAMNPMCLTQDEVDEALVAKQREIYEAQLKQDPKPKPEAVWPKIVEGKVNAWFKEIVLLDQPSAQHKKPIKELLAEAGKAAGGTLTIAAFKRFELGEGIEKKSDDLAAGVAELLQ
jgi:elongation factor Ts